MTKESKLMSAQHLLLVGSHISVAGGHDLAIERGESIGCSAMQIFTKSNRMWFDKKITDEQAERFIQAAKKSTIQSIIVHAGYLINLGSKDQTTAEKSAKALLDEVHRCEQLGLKILVLHPGSHVGAGEEKAIEQIAHNLDFVIEQSTGDVIIALETMAGQGSNVGYTFEQLAQIRALSKHKKNLGVCLDTCHIFCAGYDITTTKSYDYTIKKFDEIIGLEHLKAIHLNDSHKPCGSRLDRHAPLGEGTIPLETFSLIMNDKRLRNIPKVLETPSDPEMHLWAKEIKLLKSMTQ